MEPRIIKQIKLECIKQHKSRSYTNTLLRYSERLLANGVPIITSPKHLAMLIGIDLSYLKSMAYCSERFYRTFNIPKKSGGVRRIDEPLPDLKHVQSWILHEILERIEVSKYAKAYVKGRSLKHNARFHQRQKVLVSMDIKDFFPSIGIKSIVSIFENIGYYHDLSCFLAYLCCLDYVLPQGAPTSPYLSNIYLKELDSSIGDYVSSHNIRYTRYADDLTFSGDINPHELIPHISSLVWQSGLVVNSSKTRVARCNARQEVTGIVVNSKMQVPRYIRKDLRQQLYYIKKFGLNSHLEYIHETRSNYINHLIGQINFVLFVNPNDSEFKGYKEYLIEMMKNIKQLG